jgi:uncharacterized protein
VLTVVDDEILQLGADRVFDFFLQLGARRYACIAVQPKHVPDAELGTVPPHYASPRSTTAFLTRLYDRWLEHRDPGLYIRELDTLRRRVAGETPGMCTFSGGCIGRYFGVEPDGEVIHCDDFSVEPAYTYGNIMETSLSRMLSGPPLLKMRADNDRALAGMRQQCPEYPVCNGGCPHDRYLSARYNPEHTDSCCGLRELIEHIRMRRPDEERLFGVVGPGGQSGPAPARASVRAASDDGRRVDLAPEGERRSL